MLRRLVLTLSMGLAAASIAAAQMRGMGWCCSGTTVEVKGKISRVQITPGEGMPFLTVKTGDRAVNLYLGSMRYLMTLGFNPKVDDEVTAKAYPANGGFIAASVTLPGSGKTIRLRDEKGRPLWRGGGPPW